MSAATPPAAPQPSSSLSSTTANPLPELPWSFYECSTDTLVVLISHMLNLLIQHNDQVVLTPDSLTRFHSRAAPGITVVDYLQRIVKYTNMEVSHLTALVQSSDQSWGLAAASLESALTSSSENTPALPPRIHRYNLYQSTDFHPLILDCTSIPHRRCLRRIESAMRCFLHQQPLCQSRWHQSDGTEWAGAGIPESHTMEFMR